MPGTVHGPGRSTVACLILLVTSAAFAGCTVDNAPPEDPDTLNRIPYTVRIHNNASRDLPVHVLVRDTTSGEEVLNLTTRVARAFDFERTFPGNTTREYSIRIVHPATQDGISYITAKSTSSGCYTAAVFRFEVTEDSVDSAGGYCDWTEGTTV